MSDHRKHENDNFKRAAPEMGSCHQRQGGKTAGFRTLRSRAVVLVEVRKDHDTARPIPLGVHPNVCQVLLASVWCLQCHLIPDIHTTDGHCNTKTMWESVMKWKHRFHRRAILRQDSQTAQCVDVALVKMILPQATADSTKWTCGSNLNCSVRWIVIAGNRLEATPPSSSMGGNSAKRMNTCGISRCIPNMRFHCTDDKISHSSTIQEWYRPNWKPVHASRSWVSRAPSKVSTPVALAARHVLL